MEETKPDTMIEERPDAAMVPPTGGDPFLKTAYFLKPISSIDDEPCVKLSHCSSTKWPELEIRGWRCDHRELKTWADHLAPLHQSTWKKAGIYDAIFSSTYTIKREIDLVCGFTEKWCPETNTFVFPWGEATITLEDVMVLGGFSVLGDSAFSPLENRELKEVEETLNRERIGLYDYEAGIKAISAKQWLRKFMKSGSRFEHEAFLLFWLSRYVFHNARNCLNVSVTSIAIRLARGHRIALAQPVLANIYRDLSLLHRTIASNGLKVTLKSPFYLVQVWAWERFLNLSPKHSGIRYGEPRMARWDEVNGLNVRNLSSLLDSAGEGFMWRPYAIAIENWEFPKYYVEKEGWALVSPCLNDDELLSFYICLRMNELVGFGTVEQYLPHRVAMQFGYDQDIPCFVAHGSSDIFLPAGLKGHENVSLYIPSRLAEGDVSTRYLKWRKESVAEFKHKIMPLKIGAKRSSIEEETNEINDTTIPCTSEYLVEPFTGRNQGNDSLVPPGFALKRLRVEPGDPVDEDHLTISEALKNRKKVKNVDKGSNGENLSAPDKYVATSVADESSVNTIMLESLRKDIVLSKPLFWVGKGKRKPRKQRNVMRLMAGSQNQDILSLKDKERASSSRLFENWDCVSSTFAFERVAELKSRVSILEKMVEVLKASSFGNNITDLSESVF